MTADQIHTPTSAASPPDGTGAVQVPSPSGASSSPVERPEVQIGAAFAGGLLAALILKRIVP